jgi:hypothetical protein
LNQRGLDKIFKPEDKNFMTGLATRGDVFGPPAMTRALALISCLLFLAAGHGCEKKAKEKEEKDCECTPGMTEPCTTRCGTEGLLTCNLECTWSDCMSPPEQCNGIDDDCDGEVDETFDCTTGDTGDCITTCASEGTATCNEQCRFGPCTAVETCNGADDDCDGSCDNGFECCQGLSGVECETPWGHPGLKSCDTSCSWSDCCSEAEICWDGHDDDCDGSVDEMGSLIADARVTSDSHTSVGASIQWTGSEFGVAWADSLDVYPGIFFARISAEGSTIGGFTRVSEPEFGGFANPSIQWTGSEFGVAWEDSRLGVWLIFFARISDSGSKIGTDVQISDMGQAEDASLQWTGSEFAVSWLGGLEVDFARISPSGSVIASHAVLNDPTSNYASPSLAWSGSEFGIAWDDIWNLHWEVHFARLSSSGGMIGGDTMMTPSSSDSENPSIVWAGTMYGLAWEDGRNGGSDTYFTRISGSGEKIGGDVRVTSGFGWAKNPTIQWTGADFALAWKDDRVGQDEIFFAAYSSSVTRLGSIVRVTNASGYSERPSMQWTGSEFGLAWEDDRAGNEEIFFTRLGCLP